MAATRREISDWFDRGVEAGMAYMLVVCDRFDHEDYPVYTENDELALKAHAEHDGPNMQKVMEVYDLRLDKTTQLNEWRAFNLPVRPTNIETVLRSIRD
jgi:hypothetical protein